MMRVARQWAERSFAGEILGDQRSDERLRFVAGVLAENPHGILAKVFQDEADLWGAYRLFQREDCTYEALTAGSFARVKEACGAAGEYLLIEDFTDLDFTHRPELPGAGRIGDNRGHGWRVHTTLALRIQSWKENEPRIRVAGLMRQRCWARLDTPKKKTESKRDRLLRARESEHWAAVFEDCPALEPETWWCYVADRESDVYEVFERCARKCVHFVVRACWPRALEDTSGNIFESVRGGAVLGHYCIQLRARPGVKARWARLEVRAARVTLRAPWRPNRQLQSQPLNVVEVRETGAPAGVEPIAWVLLTDLPCETFEQARRVIALYEQRWTIEEYHKALKSGTRIEDAQLETGRQVQALFGVLALVAVRLLELKFLARDPAAPLPSAFSDKDVLRILELKAGKPKNGWDPGAVLCAIAKLGGHLKHNGAPGWQTIWLGWQTLRLLLEGLRLAQKCVQ